MRKKGYKKTKNYGIDETNNRVHKKINKQKNSDYNKFSKSINRNCESFHAIKGVLFDFDNTLEVWGSGPEKRASREWANIISKKEGLNAKVFLRLLREIKRYRLKHCYGKGVSSYSRASWLLEIIKRMNQDKGINKKIPKYKINQYENLYWGLTLRYIRLYRGVTEILSSLKKNGLKLGLISDSDGKKRYKLARVNKLGIGNFFDAIVTADDTHKNKPAKINFILTAKRMGVNTNECIMVGDSPIKDLSGSKKLGMITVLVKQARSKHVNEKKFDYVDFAFDSISNMKGFFNRLIKCKGLR